MSDVGSSGSERATNGAKTSCIPCKTHEIQQSQRKRNRSTEAPVCKSQVSAPCRVLGPFRAPRVASLKLSASLLIDKALVCCRLNKLWLCATSLCQEYRLFPVRLPSSGSLRQLEVYQNTPHNYDLSHKKQKPETCTGGSRPLLDCTYCRCTATLQRSYSTTTTP